MLDPILLAYVEDDLTASELVEAGHDPELVRQVVRLVDLAEYKRRQTPPGRAGHAEGVRPRPPDADHQPLPLDALIRCRPPARRDQARLG